MNITQLFNLKASLIASRVRLADAIEEVQHAIDEALTPDAGMVVVRAMLEPWKQGTWWRDWDGDKFDRPVYDPPPYTTTHPACDPSHLTIADGRGDGDGMATRDVLGGMMISENVWAGPSGYATWAWWDSQLGDDFPWAYNHDDRAIVERFWHPDESTTLDCAGLPSPETIGGGA